MRMTNSGIARRMMVALMMFGPSVAMADDLPGNPPQDKATGGKQQGTEWNKGEGQNLYGSFKLPEGSKLLGEASINEVRRLPEFASSPKSASVEHVMGVTAMDRVYQARGNYKKVVGFFESQLKQMNIEPAIRATTPVSTAWSVLLPDSRQTTIIVRNTQPVSFEIIQASEVSGTQRQPTGGTEQPGAGPREPGNDFHQPGNLNKGNQPGGTNKGNEPIEMPAK